MECTKHKIQMKKHGVPGSRYCPLCNKKGTPAGWKPAVMKTTRNKFMKRKKKIKWTKEGVFAKKIKTSKKAKMKGR